MSKQKEFEPLTGLYLAGKTVKKKTIQLPHPEKVWVLEYFYDKTKQWLYIEKGKGAPFGPWRIEQAIYEMETWDKSTSKRLPPWVKDGSVEWRIRNLETNETILYTIFAKA